jgi:hypothetical protein
MRLLSKRPQGTALAGCRMPDLGATMRVSANGLLLKQALRYAPQDNREVSGGSI